jgi:hypothetical protein
MKAFVPELTTLPDRKMVTVTSFGNPNKVMEPYMKALYGGAYSAKMGVFKPQGIKMELGKLTAMWPDAHLKPKEEWKGVWGVPVPEYVNLKDITQKDPNIPVGLEVWPGGTYAQILHLCGYAEEAPTIKILHDFIEAQGIAMKDVIGLHEEEYLTSPEAKVVKTIIRYRIGV